MNTCLRAKLRRQAKNSCPCKCTLDASRLVTHKTSRTNPNPPHLEIQSFVLSQSAFLIGFPRSEEGIAHLPSTATFTSDRYAERSYGPQNARRYPGCSRGCCSRPECHRHSIRRRVDPKGWHRHDRHVNDKDTHNRHAAGIPPSSQL